MALPPSGSSPPRPDPKAWVYQAPIPSRWAWPGPLLRSRFASGPRALPRRASRLSRCAVRQCTSWVTIGFIGP